MKRLKRIICWLCGHDFTVWIGIDTQGRSVWTCARCGRPILVSIRSK